tara:strand:- start:3828 stop:4139 length:312 start_codon:yes stop_codon:yes gene_type:complete
MKITPRDPVITKDPGTGEKVTLMELSERYGVSRATIYSRYLSGKRGRDLVATPNRGSLSEAEKDKQHQHQRQAYIEQAKRSPLAKPLNHIADVSKMVGGSQHA